MATITARIDDQVKAELKLFSQEIGISIGSLFNAWAKDVLRHKQVVFKLNEEQLEDQEMYANVKKLAAEGNQSLASGRSTLVI